MIFHSFSCILSFATILATPKNTISFVNRGRMLCSALFCFQNINYGYQLIDLQSLWWKLKVCIFLYWYIFPGFAEYWAFFHFSSNFQKNKEKSLLQEKKGETNVTEFQNLEHPFMLFGSFVINCNLAAKMFYVQNEVRFFSGNTFPMGIGKFPQGNGQSSSIGHWFVSLLLKSFPYFYNI